MRATSRATHSAHLERWLGPAAIERVSSAMRGWYGPPIALHGVPGQVYATADGDFIGRVRAGFEASALDRAVDLLHRAKRALDRVSATSARRAQLNVGFSSLADLISEATAGKRREFQFQKVGPTGVANVTSTLWRVGNQPAAGGAGSAAPGGRACVDATTGAFPFINPGGTDTQHFIAGYPSASVAGNTLLLYDRIFDVAKTMSSTATEAVTGVPSRYQSSSAGDDYIGGNFLFVEVVAALGNTAHNWTVCQYTNQSGSGTATLPSLTGNNSAIIDRLDHPVNQWFAPLATADTGIMKLTQMQCSASVTGSINFVIGHPIAWMPCPIAALVCVTDGLRTAFSLARIFDDACLAFLEVNKPATTATTYTGTFTTVAG